MSQEQGEVKCHAPNLEMKGKRKLLPLRNRNMDFIDSSPQGASPNTTDHIGASPTKPPLSLMLRYGLMSVSDRFPLYCSHRHCGSKWSTRNEEGKDHTVLQREVPPVTKASRKARHKTCSASHACVYLHASGVGPLSFP